jgi:acetyltransferase
MRGNGLGLRLMVALMDAARSKGLKIMEGEVLKNNASMLKLMKRLGFSIESSHDDESIKIIRKVL